MLTVIRSCLLALWLPALTAQELSPAPIDAQLQALLAELAPSETVPVIIGFREDVDVRADEPQQLLRDAGAVEIKILWIINSIAARLTAEAVDEIAKLEQVGNIRSDRIITPPALPVDSGENR
jgi:hypothetical protein